MSTATALCGTSHETLSANLIALSRRSRRAAARIGQSALSQTIQFLETQDGASPSATLAGQSLASRRRPREEAEHLATTIELQKAGAIVLMGFGLGYHAAAIAERMGRDSLLVIFEPDVALLRSVLERIDHSHWLTGRNVILLTDATSAPEIMECTSGYEALVSLGVEFVEHPPSRARLGQLSSQFAETFTRVVASMRTHVITTMVQSDVTLRNLLMNIDHYVNCSGVSELENAAVGFPAIVVSAGPSLRRNIELLKDPGVRDRCVIIAVQTVLKQLLAHGIKPHFVTALDYHEISRRFYEGLTAEDVQGVTLIAEPKANPAILESFPGAIRLVESDHLQTILGEKLAPNHGKIRPGATVAHLAYYVARHLGCDPVILVGQDLAFTDGQYYQKDAAIHDVWAGELNPFNTLEMMEWQRIVRWRGHLNKVKDVFGRDVYSDDQMQTYLAQFERDFYQDHQRGLRIIDATEGGVQKSHTEIMPLRDSLHRFAFDNRQGALNLHAPTGIPDPERQRAARFRVRERIAKLERDVHRIEQFSREAQKLLEQMQECQSNVARTNTLIEQVYELRDRVEKLQPAYGLVHRLNQTGAFKRFRADRDIRLTDDLSPQEKQRRQIERDIMNVQWLGDVAQMLGVMFRQTGDMLSGGPRLTRESPPSAKDTDSPARAGEVRATNVLCAIPLDPLFVRPDDWVSAGSLDKLCEVLIRLSMVKELDHIALLGPRAPDIISELSHRANTRRSETARPIHFASVDAQRESTGVLSVSAVDCERLSESERQSIAAGRILSESCWRGSLGGLTVFDELLRPESMAAVARTRQADGVLLVGPNWTSLDAPGCAELIRRFKEDPSSNSLTFSQAAPGYAGCVLSTMLLEELERARRENHAFATIGGILGYLPVRPRTDPIARDCCVQVPAFVRDLGSRHIADDLNPFERSCHELRMSSQSDGVCAQDLQSDISLAAQSGPQNIILELTPRRITHPFGRRDVVREDMPSDRAVTLISQIVQAWPQTVLTLAGFGDPLTYGDVICVLHAARDAGVRGVHLRTDLLCSAEETLALLEAEIDVISVDVHANSPSTYLKVTGIDGFSKVISNLERLLNARTSSAGLPIPWIVPRITRRDAVYEELEIAYDKWLLLAGAAVIDQLPYPMPGDRIEPLGKPRITAQRDWRTRMFVLSDGCVIADERDWKGEARVASVFDADPVQAWGALLKRRFDAWCAHGDEHPDLWTGW